MATIIRAKLRHELGQKLDGAAVGLDASELAGLATLLLLGADVILRMINRYLHDLGTNAANKRW